MPHGPPGPLRSPTERCSYFKCYSLNNVGQPCIAWQDFRSIVRLGGCLCCPTAEGTMTAILIVEDDVLANEHLEFILQQAGYEALSATSADGPRSCLKISQTFG